MIKVDGNLQIDNYNDNSLTINAQQNNTQFNTENQKVDGHLDSEVAKGTDGNEEKGRKIRFVAAQGQKVNLCRVIMALQQSGYFKNANGGEATQDDVFSAFGEILECDLSDFNNRIYAGSQHNNGSTASTRVFDLLKERYVQYEENLIKNRDNRK